MKRLIILLVVATISVLIGKYYLNKKESFKDKSEENLGI